MDIITSTQNQGIREILKLSKARARKESGLFTLEGEREIRRAVENDYTFSKVYFCRKHMTPESRNLLDKTGDVLKLEVSEHVFSRISYRDQSDGLFAIANIKDHSLPKLLHRDPSLYLVAEKVEKPGNLGALLRTADAAGIQTVFVCDNQTDLYNPNVIRSSLGCLFSRNVVVCESVECIRFLKENKVKIYAAALQDAIPYTDADLRGSTAIVLGAEDTGLTEIWRKAADRIISIPMLGSVDSLNVSVSAAVLVYEAIRQRK